MKALHYQMKELFFVSLRRMTQKANTWVLFGVILKKYIWPTMTCYLKLLVRKMNLSTTKANSWDFFYGSDWLCASTVTTVACLRGPSTPSFTISPMKHNPVTNIAMVHFCRTSDKFKLYVYYFHVKMFHFFRFSFNFLCHNAVLMLWLGFRLKNLLVRVRKRSSFVLQYLFGLDATVKMKTFFFFVLKNSCRWKLPLGLLKNIHTYKYQKAMLLCQKTMQWSLAVKPYRLQQHQLTTVPLHCLFTSTAEQMFTTPLPSQVPVNGSCTHFRRHVVVFVFQHPQPPPVV